MPIIHAYTVEYELQKLAFNPASGIDRFCMGCCLDALVDIQLAPVFQFQTTNTRLATPLYDYRKMFDV